MRRAGFLFLATALLLTTLGPVGAAEDGAMRTDLVISLPAAGDPRTEASETATATLVSGEPGERWTWNITTEAAYIVAEVRIEAGAFDVDRARQVVPTLDGDLFVMLHTADPSEVQEPVRVANLTRDDLDGHGITYRLGLPGPGPLDLTLTRDVQAPDFTIGAPDDIRPHGFRLVTNTTEPAIAELQTRPTDSTEDWRIDRTPNAAVRQTFPVIGLDGNTTYDVRVRFWDWAQNEVTSATFQVTTTPRPVVPSPVLQVVDPPPDGVVASGDVTVRVRVMSPDAPIPMDEVRLFLDKRPVPRQDVDLVEDMVVYHPPAPLAPGPHSVSLEVTNDLGGEAVARWTFTVEGPAMNGAPVAGVGVLLSLLAGAAAARPRYR